MAHNFFQYFKPHGNQKFKILGRRLYSPSLNEVQVAWLRRRSFIVSFLHVFSIHLSVILFPH